MATDVKLGEWLTKGFELYKQNFGLLVVTNLIAAVLGACTFGILAGPMAAGMILITLRLRRGTQPKPQIGTLFEGFNHFGQTFLFWLVWGILLGVGTGIIALIPCVGAPIAIAASLAVSTLVMFALYLIVDRGMEFWPASMASLAAVKPAFFPLLGFLIVVGILAEIGVIGCFIGIFFTLPILACSMTVAYDEFLGTAAAPAAAPEPPPTAGA